MNDELRNPRQASAAKVRLCVVAGPHAGWTAEYATPDVVVIGRGDDCQLRLVDDRAASRKHCVLRIDPPTVQVRDLGSSNGVRVNGERVRGPQAAQALVLSSGDRLGVGFSEILVEVTGGPVQRSDDLARTVHLSDTPHCHLCGRPLPAPAPADRAPVCTDCASALDAQLEAIAGVLRPASLAARVVQAQLDAAGCTLERPFTQSRFGGVYEGRMLDGGEAVLVWIVRRDDAHAHPLADQRLEVLAGLQHPHLARLRLSGAVEELCYGGFARPPGVTLQAWLEEGDGRLVAADAVELLRQALDGLAAAHAAGLVHRAVDARHLWIAREPLQTQIIGLGFAEQLLQAGVGLLVSGEPSAEVPLLPREVLTQYHRPLPANDIWSLAATIYRALTGFSPWPAESGRTPVDRLLEGSVVPLLERDASLPPKLGEVLGRALDVDLGRRWRDATQFRAALDAALGQEP